MGQPLKLYVFAVTFLHHEDSSWVTSLRTIGCFQDGSLEVGF